MTLKATLRHLVRPISGFLIMLVLSLSLFPNSFSLIQPALAYSVSNSAQHVVNEKHVPGNLIVKFKEGLSEPIKDQIIKSTGGKRIDNIGQIALTIINVPEPAMDHVKQVLEFNPNIEYVERDLLFEPQQLDPGFFVPNDPYFANQWHLETIDATSAWITSTGNGTVIAILDSGIEPTHPDLAPKIISGGFNFYDNNVDWSDISCKHGTVVAGVAAAATNNALGVASVAPDSRLLPLRVTDGNCWGSLAAIANAIVYAADSGAKVANLSFKIPDPSLAFVDAYRYMYSKGGLVVIASGNDGEYLGVPDTPEVIHVGATDSRDYVASFSTYGSFVDFVAPGQGIYSAIWNGGYGYVSGTSDAAPVVSGALALMFSAKQGATPQQVYDALKSTALDVVNRNSGSGIMSIPAGKDDYSGWGRIDVSAAIDKLTQPDITNSSSDTIAPTVSVPANIVTGATSSGGAVVSYSGVSAADNVLVVSGPTCSPGTGSMFPIGPNVISCTASDAAGNIGQSSFVISVVDNVAPVISGPSSITVQTTSPLGEYVAYVVTALDVVDGSVNPICSPPANSFFPVGDTIVNCMASDKGGNTAQSSFHINVQQKAENNDTTPPTIGINPASGTTVKGTASISVSANDDSGIGKVVIYIDNMNKPKATLTNSPYNYLWNTQVVQDGIHTVMAVAYDTAGNKASSSVQLVVANGSINGIGKPGR